MMNQHDRKHYYFDRTDPWKDIPWDDDKFIYVKGEIIATICFVVCLAVLSSYLFM